jgi:putative DNA primase/helicase
MTITNGNNGRAVMNCWSGCDFNDVIVALRVRGLWPGVNANNWTPTRHPHRPQNAGKISSIEKALFQWSKTEPLSNTMSEQYIRRIRKRDPSGIADLKHHPKIYINKTDHHPAMVAAIRDVLTGDIIGIHRTFIDAATGKKINRKMLGVSKNGAIMLDPYDAITQGLTLCEGIEDGLAIRDFTRPVWVCMSADNIRSFPLLPGVESLSIYADRDDTGQNAARECGQRWADAGCDVTIRTPIGGKDADEVLK